MMHLDKKNVEEASKKSANHRPHNRNPPEVISNSESKQEMVRHFLATLVSLPLLLTGDSFSCPHRS